MEKLFTPGPWVVNGRYIETKEGKNISDCWDMGGCRFPVQREALANATLIASSTDLLEALEFILPNIESLATERFGSKFLETYKPVLKAREAIAKAYGKEVEL